MWGGVEYVWVSVCVGGIGRDGLISHPSALAFQIQQIVRQDVADLHVMWRNCTRRCGGIVRQDVAELYDEMWRNCTTGCGGFGRRDVAEMADKVWWTSTSCGRSPQ